MRVIGGFIGVLLAVFQLMLIEAYIEEYRNSMDWWHEPVYQFMSLIWFVLLPVLGVVVGKWLEVPGNSRPKYSGYQPTRKSSDEQRRPPGMSDGAHCLNAWLCDVTK